MTRPIPLPGYAVKALAEGRLRQVRVRLRNVTLEPDGRIRIGTKYQAGLYTEDRFRQWGHQSVYFPWGIGERRWVQESWQYADWTEEGEPYVRYKADGVKRLLFVPIEQAMAVEDAWIALSEARHNRGGKLAEDTRWRSPVTMPKWASRRDLVVESVKVERVQDATEEDARAEGIRRHMEPEGNEVIEWTFKQSLAKQWIARHGPGSWERNDWCAVARVSVERRG